MRPGHEWFLKRPSPSLVLSSVLCSLILRANPATNNAAVRDSATAYKSAKWLLKASSGKMIFRRKNASTSHPTNDLNANCAIPGFGKRLEITPIHPSTTKRAENIPTCAATLKPNPAIESDWTAEARRQFNNTE